MATETYGPRAYLANLSISAYRAVVISNNGGVTYASNTSRPDGFALIDTASGDYVSVRGFFSGQSQKAVITATPVTVGDTLYAGAVGMVSTTGTITVGKSLTTTGNSQDGAIIEFVTREI